VIKPTLYQRCVLLVGTVQRALRSEAQLRHHLAQGGQAERHPEAALDKLPDKLPDKPQGPQPEVEAHLVWSAVPDRACYLMHLLGRDFWRSSTAQLGSQAVLPVTRKSC
jgi:hypothetical protein